MKFDKTKLLEWLRTNNILQNKGLIIVGLVLTAFLAYLLAPSGNKPPPKQTKTDNTQQTEKLDNSAMVDLALKKEQPQVQPIAVPQPPERIIIDNSNKTQRAPVPRQSSVVNVDGRKPTSLEQVRAVWDVDYVPVRSVNLEGKLVESKPIEFPIKEVEKEPQIQIEQKPDNVIGHILPGTEISATLTTGMLATELSNVPFVARVTNMKGPKGRTLNEYSGCLLYGTAKLNATTQRAEATTTYLSCSDRFTNLSSDGIGSDRTYGFDGRYYERLTDRLVYEFIGLGFSEYFDARARGLVVEEAYTTGEAVATTRNIVSPSEYAMWKGLSEAFNSAESELKDIGERKVPVIAIDPGRRLSFIVSAPTTVRALYEVE